MQLSWLQPQSEAVNADVCTLMHVCMHLSNKGRDLLYVHSLVPPLRGYGVRSKHAPSNGCARQDGRTAYLCRVASRRRTQE